MSNKALYFVTFAIGALAGSVATWQYAKKKYDKLIQEEIDSVKAAFTGLQQSEPELGDTCEKPTKEEVIADQKEFTTIAKQYDPSNNSKEVSHLTVISPEEFGGLSSYSIYSLTYFAGDKTLCDDSGEVLDIEETIGLDAIDCIGDYEDDAVHVRDTQARIDYEVLLDPRKYSEVYKKHE